MHKNLALSAILLLAANTAWAQSDAENLIQTKVDSRVLLEIEHAVPRMVHGPSIDEAACVRYANLVPVVIRLDTPATSEILCSLEAAGAHLRKLTPSRPSPEVGEGEDDGDRFKGILHYRQFVPATVDRDALQALSRLSHVQQIVSAPARGPAPMDHSADLIGLKAAWGSQPTMDLLTGEGILVANIDTNADIFHPQFFRADAGYFDWIDVDGDEAFTPGIDAIDLDGDGVALNETGLLLRSETVMLQYGYPVDAREDGFEPAIDWLYIDENANGERDYGAANGFDDETPALGEPLFVPDDLNANGILDKGERVARLGTSKIAKVFHFFNYSGYETIDRVYERGVDLAEFDTNFLNESDVFSAAGHATGVMSIIAGDVPLAGRRWVGVAPGVDLMLAVDMDAGYGGTGLTWVLSEGADVVLHERANWYGEPLDGTDITSVMVDESTVSDGVTHTCPVGNTGGGRKHTRMELPSGGSQQAAFEVSNLQGLYYINLSINLRGIGDALLTLTPPVGDPIVLTTTMETGPLSGGAQYYHSYLETVKGTRFHEVILYADSSASEIPLGDWLLSAVEQGAGDLNIDAYLSDNTSSWGVGVAWDESIATDDRTIGWPATSETCIAIGAHTGHPTTPEEPWFYAEGDPGEVRYYSGQGPTIDGRQKPDITAPDNPWAATAHGQASGGDVVPHGAVAPFGGTSGAGPHVTGVTAMLAQIGIVGDDATQAIRDGAHVDDMVGDVPNYAYGWGRLNAAGALGVSNDGVAPTVSLVPGEAFAGKPMVIEVVVQDEDSDESQLQIKWDDDYDGTWDDDYTAASNREVTFEEIGEYILKARVRDDTGLFAEALAHISVIESPPGSGDDGCGCDTVGDRPSKDPGLIETVIDLWWPG